MYIYIYIYIYTYWNQVALPTLPHVASNCNQFTTGARDVFSSGAPESCKLPVQTSLPLASIGSLQSSQSCLCLKRQAAQPSMKTHCAGQGSARARVLFSKLSMEDSHRAWVRNDTLEASEVKAAASGAAYVEVFRPARWRSRASTHSWFQKSQMSLIIHIRVYTHIRVYVCIYIYIYIYIYIHMHTYIYIDILVGPIFPKWRRQFRAAWAELPGFRAAQGRACWAWAARTG